MNPIKKLTDKLTHNRGDIIKVVEEFSAESYNSNIPPRERRAWAGITASPASRKTKLKKR